MLKSNVKALLVLLAALVAPIGAAKADIFNLAQYNLVGGEEANSYELTAQVPEAAAATSAPVGWPEGCRQIDADRQIQAGRAHLAFSIECERPLGREDVIRTPWSVDGAVFASTVAGAAANAVLQVNEDGAVDLPLGIVAGAARPLSVVAADYLWQGIIHILMGWDHLAFILCLCLLTRGRTLLWLVTTFTVGHSISLALAFFEVIRIAVPPVEAVIALSIALMAREAMRSDGSGAESPRTRLRYMAVVGCFGLLHGLGFASVLGDLGVSPHEKVGGLIFFNLGVEVGQLMFVAVVAGIMAAARRLEFATPLRHAALYGAGALGCFWMFERVAGFGTPMA